mmetsp:Transcript_34530/g.80727  ORF Transcript_34530/g.80727 Transcript_34530/m.80727 type:complete len:287 (-) Transcript_34530:179-1039(-)
MEKHLHHAATQERALQNLIESIRNGEDPMLARVRTVRLGGVHAVLAAMTFHWQNRLLQARACEVLWNLMIDSDSNTAAILEAGGVGPVISAMKLHLSCADVQAHGCTALRNLAFESAERQHMVVVLGGVQAILSGMREHHDNHRVQLQGCGAVINLCHSKCPDGVLVAASNDVIFVLKLALERHISTQDVAGKVLGAARAFFRSPDSAREAVHVGFLPLLVHVMGRHLHDVSVQKHGCVILSLLAVEHALEVIRCNGHVAVTAAMQQHATVFGLQKYGRAVMQLVN